MYKITLSDGSQLENLTLNGNNYIAQGEIADSVFEGKLDTVKISDGENEETYADMVLVSNIVREGKSWFILGQKSEEEKQREAINSSFTDLQMALAEVYEMVIGGAING